MLESPKAVRKSSDRVEARRAQARADILDAAWAIVRAEGLAALSLRDLAERVGIRAPSLYSYFSGKDAIYDAMFAEGYTALQEVHDQFRALDLTGRDGLKAGARVFFDFCTEDPARYQLMFQRTIPGWEPTPETYALSVAALEDSARYLAECGITEPTALDMWTAVLTGLTDQQISNDPGGERWGRLLDEAMDLLCDHYL